MTEGLIEGQTVRRMEAEMWDERQLKKIRVAGKVEEKNRERGR